MVFVYLLAIVIANLLAAWFGPWITIVNAFILIGLDLTTRDRLHERWRDNHLALRMASLIAAGAILSWLMNPTAGRVGLASFVAFGASQAVDATVYHRTRSVHWSNASGAIVDSVLFPTLAFGVFLPWVVLGQTLAKIIGGAIWKRGLDAFSSR